MKKTLITILSALSLMACNTKSENQSITQTQNSTIMEKQEKQSIEQLLNTYQSALNTSNAKLAQSLYTKDGVFMPTEAPTAIGSENVLKAYEFVFSQIQLNINFSIEEIEVENELAFAYTTSKGTVKILANGIEAPEANRELFVFQKENGQWKIARYMFNKSEPKS